MPSFFKGKRFAILVNENDIASGKRDSTCYCPIALAIRRAIDDEGVVNINVFRDTVQLNEDVATLPSIAETFVEHFDEMRPVSPFSFELVFAE